MRYGDLQFTRTRTSATIGRGETDVINAAVALAFALRSQLSGRCPHALTIRSEVAGAGAKYRFVLPDAVDVDGNRIAVWSVTPNTLMGTNLLFGGQSIAMLELAQEQSGGRLTGVSRT